MSPIAAAILAGVGGLLAGALIVALLVHRLRPPAPASAAVASADWSAMVDLVPSGAAVVGAHDDLVTSNAAARSLTLVKGTRIGIPAVLDLVRECRASGDSASADIDLKSNRGRVTAQLAVRVSPLKDGLVAVVAEDRVPALRMHESTRDFMTNATHELKTPIGAISLLGEAIQEASDDPDTVHRFAERVLAESERLRLLVEQVLTLSKLQGRGLERDTELVDIDELVYEAIERCRSQAASRDVSVTAKLTPGLTVSGDGEQLVAAVANLIHNAISYSDPRARVVVTTRPSGDADEPMVDIAVSDNGIGISLAEQERIFERFYRVDYARSRETGGTGLGLSIVTEIVEGHFGDIEVWSRPGQGSTFTVRLPAAAPDADAELALEGDPS